MLIVKLSPLPAKPPLALPSQSVTVAVVVAPQDVGHAVAVEVAGADDVPVGDDIDVEVRAVAGEAAVRLAQPVGDGAVVGAPQDVGLAVAVEVAGAGHLPVGSRC